jgi:hypothetical protein
MLPFELGEETHEKSEDSLRTGHEPNSERPRYPVQLI